MLKLNIHCMKKYIKIVIKGLFCASFVFSPEQMSFVTNRVPKVKLTWAAYIVLKNKGLATIKMQ